MNRDKHNLLAYHRSMLRIRLIEEAIAEHYTEQQMRCPVHLSIGQEAVAVGACAALNESDYVMSGHRSHAHYLAKGGDLKAMLCELYGRVDGCCAGKGGSMHLVDLSVNFLGAVPIVGSTIPIATGTALTSQMNGENRVTLSFLGEGATEEGVFHESLNFASLKKLPIVYVCENNLYSVYTPLDQRQPIHRQVFEQGLAHGIECYQFDGNDVSLVQSEVQSAVNKAREGNGPTLLEFTTYRWREHCGPNFDNHIGYRTEEEYLTWKEKCPLEFARHQLKSVPDDELIKMTYEIEEEIRDAFGFAKQSPYPEKSTAQENLYA